MIEKICSICNQKFSLFENQSGLVFTDQHFVCEQCCDKHSQEELNELTKTIMQSSNTGMPIGLWLIHELNKNKTMKTVKK